MNSWGQNSEFSAGVSSPPPTPRHTRATVAGRVIHAVEMGAETRGGAPVFVLVHGLGMSSRYLMPTAELLAP